MMSSCIVISQHDVILIDWVFKCVHKAIIEVMIPSILRTSARLLPWCHHLVPCPLHLSKSLFPGSARDMSLVLVRTCSVSRSLANAEGAADPPRVWHYQDQPGEHMLHWHEPPCWPLAAFTTKQYQAHCPTNTRNFLFQFISALLHTKEW